MKTDNGTYDIPAYNFPALVEAIEKLNRRAPKLGCTPIELRVVREYEVEKVRETTRLTYRQKRMEVEVIGETPKFEGWSLLASIEKLETGENMVRTVPGKTVPESYRYTDTHCDHCHAQRRRKEVFILGHDDGRFAQVGRQCIADFLGHVSAGQLANRATWEFSVLDVAGDADDEDFCYSGGRGELRRDMHEFLGTVAICIRRLGWKSKAMIEKMGDPTEVTTASTAWEILTRPGDRYVKEFVEHHQLYAEDRDTTLAGEALEWARSTPTAGVSDYEYNLGAACRQDFVNYRTMGIVASAVSAYLRHLDRLEELNLQRRKNVERKHVGEVGKRMDFANVTVKRMKYFDSAYGVKTLVRFETEDGHVLIWWASKDLEEIEKDDVCDIRGTIVKHSDYNGCPQTELKRVQVKRVLTAETATIAEENESGGYS
jgi:hypothetical protein